MTEWLRRTSRSLPPVATSLAAPIAIGNGGLKTHRRPKQGDHQQPDSPRNIRDRDPLMDVRRGCLLLVLAPTRAELPGARPPGEKGGGVSAPRGPCPGGWVN